MLVLLKSWDVFFSKGNFGFHRNLCFIFLFMISIFQTSLYSLSINISVTFLKSFFQNLIKNAFLFVINVSFLLSSNYQKIVLLQSSKNV